jgi:hypothetical protein
MTGATLGRLIDAALLRASREHVATVERIRLAVLAYKERQITYDELRQVLR